MSQYLGTHASVPRNVEDQEDVADTLAVQLNIFLIFFLNICPAKYFHLLF